MCTNFFVDTYIISFSSIVEYHSIITTINNINSGLFDDPSNFYDNSERKIEKILYIIYDKNQNCYHMIFRSLGFLLDTSILVKNFNAKDLSTIQQVNKYFIDQLLNTNNSPFILFKNDTDMLSHLHFKKYAEVVFTKA
jgi:hypothetical protein